MFTTLQQRLYAYATVRTTVFLFILTQIVYVFMLTVTIPHVRGYADDMELFDLRPTGYSADYAHDLLDALGEEGRHAYLVRQLPADAIYPALFAVSYALLLTLLFRYGFRSSGSIQHLNGVPVLAGLLDYLENIGIGLMLARFPDFSPWLAGVTSLLSIAKSVATTLTFTLVLIGVVAAIVRWGKARGEIGHIAAGD